MWEWFNVWKISFQSTNVIDYKPQKRNSSKHVQQSSIFTIYSVNYMKLFTGDFNLINCSEFWILVLEQRSSWTIFLSTFPFGWGKKIFVNWSEKSHQHPISKGHSLIVIYKYKFSHEIHEKCSSIHWNCFAHHSIPFEMKWFFKISC